MSILVKKNGNRSSIPSLMDDFFNTDRFFGPSVLDFNRDLLKFDFKDSMMIPEANIIENEKEFKIELAAPGLEKSDFKVEIQDGILSVSAERKDEKLQEKKNYRRREFSYNSFIRSFVLPDNLINDKIDAKYENGVLMLSLPKKELSIMKQVKQIQVS